MHDAGVLKDPASKTFPLELYGDLFVSAFSPSRFAHYFIPIPWERVALFS